MSDAGGANDAEILRLAHQLGVVPSRLEFLSGVAPDDLRALRRQLGATLFATDRHRFARLVAAARLLPPALAARACEAAVPPLLAARTAELLEPDRAVEMVRRLPIGYVADVSTALDPARAASVVARMPAETVAAVGAELAQRREWVVMGQFVAYVSPGALRATVARLTGAQLLSVCHLLEDRGRVGEIVAVMRDDQLDALLTAAAAGRSAELAFVLAWLPAEQRRRVTARDAQMRRGRAAEANPPANGEGVAEGLT